MPIEAEMRKICKEKLKLERFELPREEAIKYMQEKDEPYKVELINDLPDDAHISFYTQGEFTDLCAGPHLDSTGRIKGNAIKLTQCCSAYWRGDSKRKMLQRIYAVAFPKKEELDAVPRRAGRSPQARPQQARPRPGILHHRRLHRPGPAHSPAEGRARHPAAAALGRGRRAGARLSAHQDSAHGQARALQDLRPLGSLP